MVTAETMLGGVPGVSPSASLDEAARLLRETGLCVLPVQTGIDIVGSISEKDLALKGCVTSPYRAGTIVADVMTAEPVLCGASAPAEDALAPMAGAGIAAVIVVGANGRVVGVATLAQVLDGLKRPLPEGPLPNSVKRVRGEPL